MAIESVHIKEQALFSMLLSTVEVYRHESLGLLLGYKGVNEFIIEYAVPYQTAMKGYSWVAPRSTAAERMGKILKYVPINLIGDFHSHTQWGDSMAMPVPSGDDIADMQIDKVHIIVAINDKTKLQKWCSKNTVLVGSLGGYAIEIGAFILKGEYEAKTIKIICPSATGLCY